MMTGQDGQQQAVLGVDHEAQIERAGGKLRGRHGVTCLAPHHADDLFQGRGQPKGQEEAEKRIPAVGAMNDQTFQDQPDHADKDRREDQGHPEPHELLHGECEIGPEGEEDSVGEIDDLHHPQDQGEAQGHHREDKAEDQTVHGEREQFCHGALTWDDRSLGDPRCGLRECGRPTSPGDARRRRDPRLSAAVLGNI